jgi:hypothetical protein
MFRVPTWAICYIRYTVESYDGLAVVSTLDPKQGTLHIQVAPGCEGILDDLIASMAKHEKIPIREIEVRIYPDNPLNPPGRAEVDVF